LNYGLYSSATASNGFFACVPSDQPKSLLFKLKRGWTIIADVIRDGIA